MSRLEFSRRRCGFLLGGGIAAAATSLWPRNGEAAASMRLRQEWFPYSGFAGEVLAAMKYAPGLNVNLQVIAGGETIDPIKTVLSGQDQMGVASGDLVIMAIARGAPVISIGIVNDISPTCFIVRADSDIRGPQDFPGKRVGILAGTNTQRIYELMMLRNNIDRKKVQEVEAPFDVHTFMLGQYDVRPAFIYDEPVTLARAGMQFRIIKPQDFGVTSIGTVYFTRKDVMARRRSDLVATLRALVSGWRDVATTAGQEEAIAALKKQFPDVDASREAESLKLGASYFLGPAGTNRPLDLNLAHLLDTIHGLEQLKSLKPGVVKAENVWAPSLLNDAYAQLSHL